MYIGAKRRYMNTLPFLSFSLPLLKFQRLQRLGISEASFAFDFRLKSQGYIPITIHFIPIKLLAYVEIFAVYRMHIIESGSIPKF